MTYCMGDRNIVAVATSSTWVPHTPADANLLQWDGMLYSFIDGIKYVSKVEQLRFSYRTSVVRRNRWCSSVPYSWCDKALNKQFPSPRILWIFRPFRFKNSSRCCRCSKLNEYFIMISNYSLYLGWNPLRWALQY